MPRSTITIETVLGGISPTQNFSREGQFNSSIGIDPDFAVDDDDIRSSGLLRPTSMSKFSSTEITGVPLWFVTNPKSNNTYVYANDGKVHTVTSALAMGTALNGGAAMSAATGNGAAYYDNYAYFAKNADIARYGPLDGSPTLTQDYWTSTLSLTAPSDTTYPSIRGIEIPNHPMHRHTDDKLYFGDVESTNKGILSYVKTSRTSVEGDTNSGSTYNALDFDHGEYPTCIQTYGNDLAIGLIEGTDTTIRQKPAKVSFWDTTGSSFQKITSVELNDPLITAMLNVNGVLWCWVGNASGGYRVITFAGGYSFKEVFYSEEGVPPFQGAVGHDLNRVYWGHYTTYPEASASVLSMGSKVFGLPVGTHNVIKSTSSGANQTVSSLALLEHANGSLVRPVVGWTDDDGKGLDKISTTYGVSVWRSPVYRIGKPFSVEKIVIPLAQAVAANMTITPKLFYDNLAANDTLTAINNTNFPNSERVAVIYPDGADGNHTFLLELRWSGTALLTVGLPIEITIDIKDV